MKLDRISIDPIKLCIEVSGNPGLEAEYLRGFIAGLNGATKTDGSVAFVTGMLYGHEAREWTKAHREQRSQAGRRSAEVRAEKHGSAQPTQFRSEPRSESVRDVVRESFGKGSRKPAVALNPPTVEEVEEYRKQIGGTLPAAEFVDSNTARGWVQGKVKVVDWKAHYRAWNRRQRGGDASSPLAPTLLDRCSPYLTYWHSKDGIKEAEEALAGAKTLYSEDEIVEAIKWRFGEVKARIPLTELFSVILCHKGKAHAPAMPKQAEGYDRLIQVLSKAGRPAFEAKTGCGPITDERLAKARIYGQDWIREVLADWDKP
jgi:hypothetical protein